MMELTTKLEEREKVILNLRFGLQGDKPKTPRKSAVPSDARERVRQIQNQALETSALLDEERTLEDFAREAEEAEDEDDSEKAKFILTTKGTKRFLRD